MKEPTSIHGASIYGRDCVVYILKDGEGQDTHVHDYDHAIFVASGRAIVSGPNKTYGYDEGSIVYAKANVPHSFMAEGDAVVLTVLPGTGLKGIRWVE